MVYLAQEPGTGFRATGGSPAAFIWPGTATRCTWPMRQHRQPRVPVGLVASTRHGCPGKADRSTAAGVLQEPGVSYEGIDTVNGLIYAALRRDGLGIYRRSPTGFIVSEPSSASNAWRHAFAATPAFVTDGLGGPGDRRRNRRTRRRSWARRDRRPGPRSRTRRQLRLCCGGLGGAGRRRHLGPACAEGERSDESIGQRDPRRLLGGPAYLRGLERRV